LINIPTDLEILEEIHEMYISDYLLNIKGREAKIFVPIDCLRVARNLGTDGNIIFGRLYYDLDKRYGYKKNETSIVHFFSLKVGEDRHCINFPMLSSVLAGLINENKKFITTTKISILAIILASISIIISIVK